jgi:hypothetical protein
MKYFASVLAFSLLATAIGCTRLMCKDAVNSEARAP